MDMRYLERADDEATFFTLTLFTMTLGISGLVLGLVAETFWITCFWATLISSSLGCPVSRWRDPDSLKDLAREVVILFK
uniref:Uncharacterized protein n=1 Tax=Vespula pensylvanica TaxID=30213 RepID=A0A834PEU4_VESPE|nr:hypothetical protein H0235_000746 [Vespula pensylvanica]